MSTLETRLLSRMGEEWNDATEGFCLQAFHRGRKIADLEVGETYRFYDWASLTKIIFSTTALMLLFDEKRFRLSDRVNRWVSWFPEKHPATLKHLLTHDAGMHWWHPFYKKVSLKSEAFAREHGGRAPSPEQAWEIFQPILRRQLLADLKKNGTRVARDKSVYSDVDFFLLGDALESITGSNLYSMWSELRDRMGLEKTDFHRGNRPHFKRSSYAPTEIDKAWRKRLLQGEVHDENTWALKGVAPHAGLFGPIEDLSRYGLLLRAAMRDEQTTQQKRAFVSHAIAKRFTTRSIPRARGDWALGFVMPSREKSTAGPLFSPKSVGHTGFTGTSLWYDPVRDLLVTILSNRVHPTRENTRFQTLRPLLHTWIVEDLERK